MDTTSATQTMAHPGKRAASFGHMAKQAVADARAAGAELPKNAQGMAARAVAKGAETTEIFAQYTPPPPEPAPDPGAVTDPVAEPAPDVADPPPVEDAAPDLQDTGETAAATDLRLLAVEGYQTVLDMNA